MEKLIIIALFSLVASFSFGQTVKKLKSENAKLTAAIDTLMDDQEVILDSLKETTSELDSLKNVIASQIEAELKEKGKPTTVWGWLALIGGVLLKLFTAGTLTSIASKLLEVKTIVGRWISGKNSGFIITLIVSGVISLVAEVIIHPFISDFSFSHLLTIFPQVSVVAMALYTFVLKKPLSKAVAKV